MTTSPLSLDPVDHNSSLRHRLTVVVSLGRMVPTHHHFWSASLLQDPTSLLEILDPQFPHLLVLTVAWPVGNAGGLGSGKTPPYGVFFLTSVNMKYYTMYQKLKLSYTNPLFNKGV